MSRLIVSNKQRNLILNSDSAKEDFKELYYFLQDHKELRTNDLKIYKQLKTMHSYYDQLLIECQSEWRVAKENAYNDLGENYKKLQRECELCSQKNIRYEHKIENKVNKKILVVGSECVKEFGAGIQSVLREEIRKIKSAKRIQIAEEKISGIRVFRDNSHRFINNLDTIIPLSLDNKWKKLSKKIANEYDDFVSNKIEDLYNLELLWLRKITLEKEINKFIKENKDKRFITSKSVFVWLKRKNEFDTIKMIKEDNGYIKWRTAHRIYEESFMKETLENLTEHLNKLGINPIKVNVGSRKVSLDFNKSGKNITGVLSFQELVMECAGVLFGETVDYSFQDVYQICEIEDRESINKILSLTQKSKHRLIKKYIDQGELIYFKDNQYSLCKLEAIIKKFKKYYFSKTLDRENVTQLISKLTYKVMNQNQFELYEEIKAEANKFR